jgi:hypothetical protein
MSRWIRSSTLCAFLGLGLCLGTSQARADISLNTSPGMPAAGTPDTNGYTAGFYTDGTINGLTNYPSGLSTAPVPTSSGIPGAATAFTPVVVGPNGTFPIPPWIPNSPASSWIGPTSNGAWVSPLSKPINGFDPATSAPQGYYYYDKSFNLSTTTNAHLTGGLWSTDNNGISIYLNGQFEANATPFNGFLNFNSFTVNSADFVPGMNHIDFVVFNENFTSTPGRSPTGLNVEGTVSNSPEPSTMAVAVLGAIGFLGYGLRRRKAKGG